MKKIICFLLAFVLAFTLIGCNGGGNAGESSSESTAGSVHTHNYVLVNPQKPTCTEKGHSVYFTCGCGKMFKKVGSNYVETTMEAVTLNAKGHAFTAETVAEDYFIAEANETTPQVYAKSCVLCGQKSEDETFTYGKTLTEYKNTDASLYTPNALTMSLYDVSNCIYGFTWNTEAEPARPVLNVKNLSTGEESSVRARFERATSYELENGSDSEIEYYSCKAEMTLVPNTEYEYCVGDKYADVFTNKVKIKSVNPSENGKWKFVHVSDSQAEGDVSNGGVGTEAAFAKVLQNVETQSNVRFLVHTGDVVEYSKYQSYWKNMLNGNFKFLSKLPIMAISGNHETTYKNGSNETFNRFDYKIPEQETKLGFYYTYSYGGVKFIMLNTNRLRSSCLTDDQYSWLENELKNKTEKWTVIAMHNPMYSVGKWGSDASRNAIALALTAQLGQLFADYGVDVVLQGHDHMVSATHPINAEGKATAEHIETIDGVGYIKDPNGVIYVMNGPAGNQSRTDIYDHDESLYAYAMTSQSSSWAEFEVYGDSLTVTVKTAHSGNASEIAKWGIKKSD